MLTPVFVCIGLMDAWIERKEIIRIMANKSGVKGMIVSLLLGVATAVPFYALLPVASILLKKGSRITNVLLFLCASPSILISLILFEISSLGWRFTAIRLLLNLGVVIAISTITEIILNSKDKENIYNNADDISA